MVIINSGPKSGKSTQEITLKEPDWAWFFVNKNAEGKIAESFIRHIVNLNKKPFIEKCHSCKKDANRLVAYAGNAESVTFWCDKCDPYTLGSRRGMLRDIRKFSEAMKFVELTCKNRRADKRIIIKKLAQAKGLPARVSKDKAIEFLGS